MQNPHSSQVGGVPAVLLCERDEHRSAQSSVGVQLEECQRTVPSQCHYVSTMHYMFQHPHTGEVLGRSKKQPSGRCWHACNLQIIQVTIIFVVMYNMKTWYCCLGGIKYKIFLLLWQLGCSRIVSTTLWHCLHLQNVTYVLIMHCYYDNSIFIVIN